MNALLDFIVPPPQDRRPYTLATFPFTFAWLAFVFLAAHIRIHHAKLALVWRLMFASIAIPFTFRSIFSFYATFSKRNKDGSFFSLSMWDFGKGLWAVVGMGVMLEYLFCTDDDIFNVAGWRAYKTNIQNNANGNGDGENNSNGNSAMQNGNVVKHTLNTTAKVQRPRVFPGTSIPLSIDVACASLRGLGYERGESLQKTSVHKAGYAALLEAEKLLRKPPEEAVRLKRQTVLRVTLYTFKSWLTLNILNTIVHHPDIFPSPQRTGPPMRLDDACSGIFGRLGPYLLSPMFGAYIVTAAVELQHGAMYLVSLLFTKLVNVPITISRYEPFLFNGILTSTSVRQFWGHGWHAMYRRTFVFVGYQPVRFIARLFCLPRPIARALGTLAVFLISGLVHELCLEGLIPHFKHWSKDDQNDGKPLRTFDRGFGARQFQTTRFFLAQGFAIILEEVWSEAIEPWLACIVYQKTNPGRKQQRQERMVVVSGHLRNVLGWCWCMGWLMYFGRDLIDLWLANGVNAASHGGPHLVQPVLQRIVDLFPRGTR